MRDAYFFFPFFVGSQWSYRSLAYINAFCSELFMFSVSLIQQISLEKDSEKLKLYWYLLLFKIIYICIQYFLKLKYILFY